MSKKGAYWAEPDVWRVSKGVCAWEGEEGEGVYSDIKQGILEVHLIPLFIGLHVYMVFLSLKSN